MYRLAKFVWFLILLILLNSPLNLFKICKSLLIYLVQLKTLNIVIKCHLYSVKYKAKEMVLEHLFLTYNKFQKP